MTACRLERMAVNSRGVWGQLLVDGALFAHTLEPGLATAVKPGEYALRLNTHQPLQQELVELHRVDVERTSGAWIRPGVEAAADGVSIILLQAHRDPDQDASTALASAMAEALRGVAKAVIMTVVALPGTPQTVSVGRLDLGDSAGRLKELA